MTGGAPGGPLHSFAAALQSVAAQLSKAGIERPQAEARLLLEAASGVSRAEIIGFPERALQPAQAAALELMAARRCRREPISRILGRREFWSLSFRVTEATLDPRPDSETLVAAVLGQIADRNAALNLLDLGTGSGCLLLALLSELPQSLGIGVDISGTAIATARLNAAELGLQDRATFREGDWGRDLESKQFEIVISNPPYIESAEIAGLEPEVAQYDPLAALDGGADGLDAYRTLIPHAARMLSPLGILALEIGAGQAEAVGRLASAAGLAGIGTADDLGGIARCLLFAAGRN